MLNNNGIAKVEVCVDTEKIEEFIDSIPVNEMSSTERTKLLKRFQERVLGVAIPESVDQSLSLGGNQIGVQIVDGGFNVNVFDSSFVLDLVTKLIEKDPELIVRLAEVIASKSR